MAFTVNAVGNALTPFDSFLLLRGTKTLAIRMDRQQSSAMLVAQMLQRLGFVTHYPGLPGHPGKEVHERIADGYGAVLSFETGDKELSERIVGAARLWGISVSFGCVNSLISMPCIMSYVVIFFTEPHIPILNSTDMLRLIQLFALLVGSLRTSSVFVSVLRTLTTCWTTWSMPF